MDPSPFTKLLDPLWLKAYAEAMHDLDLAAKELGPDGFKKVMEIERAKISEAHDAKMAEMKADHENEMLRLQAKHDLRMQELQRENRFFGIQLWQVLFLLAMVASIVTALIASSKG